MNKIKLVAIAKDEACYLAEWIFHHLYFGFDEIEILYNRTSDNSVNILSKISGIYPRVKFRSIDWIDYTAENVAAHMQLIAYADAYEKAKKDFNFICFLDIDEFWVSRSFDKKIHDLIDRLDEECAVFFEWVTEAGCKEPFAPLFKSAQYKLSRLGKSLISTKAKVKTIDIHKPILWHPECMIMADGGVFEDALSEGLNHQFVSANRSSVKDFFVIHRMSRSEIEYFSILYRGDVYSKKKDFKVNRSVGYELATKESINIDFPDAAWGKYLERRSHFFNSISLEAEMESAKSSVMGRYQEALSELAGGLSRHGYSLVDTLKNIEIPEVVIEIERYKNSGG
ncbi:glycosyltransferase family 92 protein [Pseudomonas oryzihabitans]|uniref:glycosyltransferase family 92 protein n=1 Tax=Pseudomonas oryzihabitans TaxID=47885 RepID=UPI0011A3C047|nr:glycosyltransferase family 2 protein [Pseudomonas oryzihabitans]